MSWHGRILLLAFLTFATGNLAKAQCEDAKSTLQINECFAKELKKADAEVSRVYHSTVKKLHETRPRIPPMHGSRQLRTPPKAN